ncbi:MAG: hypothetical protein K6G94_00240 [Kiritimatiellae bacterium]|nr:hypothetical protein [Kiritimatiellia bacterium]
MTKKTRVDAWGEDLPEKVRWDIYDTARTMPWPQAVCDQLEALGVKRLPTRAAWYRFLSRMRQADAERRIEKIAQSVAEAEKVADKHGIKAKVFVETMKSLAIDSAMTGDNKSATALAAAAAAIWDRAQKERDLELKTARQKTAEESLKLAREKFEAAERRENAAKGAIADTKLTDEERVAKIKSIFGMK